MKHLASLAFVLSLVAAAPATGNASKKTTLTYTATTTTTLQPIVTGKTGIVKYETVYTGPVVSTFASSITGTSTYTYSQTHTSYTHPKAAHTVSVPTSKGFTPLLSESEYTDAIRVIKKTETLTLYTSTYDPSPSYVYTKTNYQQSTVITGTSEVDTTVYATHIATKTSTLPSVATTTVYAACASNNIVRKIPTGQNLEPENFQYTNATTSYGVYDTAVDCCASCMAAGGCAGGFFYINGGTPTCRSYTLNPQNASQVCDGSKDYSTFSYGAPDSAIEGTAIFNGPCGGNEWVFDSRAYFK